MTLRSRPQRPLPTLEGLDEVRHSLLANRTRLPFVVEFSGLPKAGKTTIVKRTVNILTSLGFQCEVVAEAATTKIHRSFKKDLFVFNSLCSLENVAQLLKTLELAPSTDIVLFDRGVNDSIIWLRFLSEVGLLTKQRESVFREFMRMPQWHDRAHLLVFLDSDWDSYEYRFYLDSPYADYPVVNRQHFDVLRDCYKSAMAASSASSSHIAKCEFDASLKCLAAHKSSIARVSEENWQQALEASTVIAQQVLNRMLIGNTEFIAVLPSDAIQPEVAQEMSTEDMLHFIERAFGRIDKYGRGGASARFKDMPSVEFRRRDTVEGDPSLVQLVAACIIVHKDEYLVLKRSSSEKRPQLRNKSTLIVSGHVDQSDCRLAHGHGKNEVENALFRELKEELINIDFVSVEPAFAFRRGDDEMGRRHLGLVYRVHTLSPLVNVRLLPGAGAYEVNPEFKSLAYIKNRRAEFDDWSQHIIDKL